MSSSAEDLYAVFAKPPSIRNQLNDYRHPSSSSQSPDHGYHSTSFDHPTTPSTSTRANGVQSARHPVATSFHWSRMYSQPCAVHNASQVNGSARHRTGNSGGANSTPLRAPRPGDPKPTRITKVSRPSNILTSPPLPSLNGNAAVSGGGYFPPAATAPCAPIQTRSSSDTRTQNLHTSNSSSQVDNPGLSRPHRIINEPAPFKTAASSNSSICNIYDIDDFHSRPSRDSMDSEERPFEHWYRGEVSRNGGVGELRIGKRQEMLEIANYVHAINNKRKAVANRQVALLALEDSSRRVRKRADSIAGIRVMDEDPLTDVEWEGSDIGSISTHNHSHHYHHRFSNHNADPDFIAGVGDDTTSTPYTDTPMTSYDEDARRHTPTQMARATPTPRSKSRQDSSPSRIPTISSERKSSESRVSSTAQHSFPKGQIPPQPPVVDLTTFTTTSSTSNTPSPPPSPGNPRSATQVQTSVVFHPAQIRLLSSLHPMPRHKRK